MKINNYFLILLFILFSQNVNGMYLNNANNEFSGKYIFKCIEESLYKIKEFLVNNKKSM
jgi:hypothetical protein